jgi:hypothetical protein
VREKRSLALYNELKSRWERENYIEVCTYEERRGIGWRKMSIWRLKRWRGIIDKGVCPVCRNEGVTSCNMKEQGTGGTKKFTRIHPEIGI